VTPPQGPCAKRRQPGARCAWAILVAYTSSVAVGEPRRALTRTAARCTGQFRCTKLAAQLQRCDVELAANRGNCSRQSMNRDVQARTASNCRPALRAILAVQGVRRSYNVVMLSWPKVSVKSCGWERVVQKRSRFPSRGPKCWTLGEGSSCCGAAATQVC
jgi:hypothetical protein